MKYLFLLILSALPLSSYAEVKTNGIVGGGLAFGGDAIINNIEFEDGSTDDVDAGEGFWVDVGMRFDFGAWALKGTAGYKTGGTFAANGDATFSRFPLTGIASYNNNGHYFGGGFTHELSPTLDVDLPYASGSADFDDATGLVLEYENNYDRWAWGIRYTNIEYTHSSSGSDFDGSNIAAFAHFYF
ncbi:hypothetical protein [Kangiella marina]|uniref:Outer membrane protein beta-barrel domain-containing protein n=1 Tax=Kangiella marina TaxID=1079178 RepID=A0ABP8IBF3_9GAMM